MSLNDFDEIELKKKMFRRFLNVILNHGLDDIELGSAVQNPLYLVKEICEFIESSQDDLHKCAVNHSLH